MRYILTLALCASVRADMMDEMMRERQAKSAVAHKLSSHGAQPAVKIPVIEREVEKAEMLIHAAKDEAADAVKAAQKNADQADALARKASLIDTSFESQMPKDFKKKQQKTEWEISFLQSESEKAALSNKDTKFLNKEIHNLEQSKQQAVNTIRQKTLLAKQQQTELSKKASLLKAAADVDLDKAEKRLAGVEAVAQQNEDSHSPAWVVHAQLTEVQTSKTAQEEAAWKEFSSKKRALWQTQGKELTCSEEAPEVHAFILDTKKDGSSRATCLERQLNKYCLKNQRAPTVSALQATQLVGKTGDCLPNGVNERIPASKRGVVGARWCTMVQLLQGVASQPTKYPYFLMLEDDVKLDPKNFEEMVVGFAKKYKSEPWALAQIDPFGKHSERDEDMLSSFEGMPVMRNSRHGEYFGLHNVLVKTSFAPMILKKMMSMPAVPLDTLPSLMNEEACDEGGCRMTMPTAVALQAFITESPKASDFATSLVQRETQPHVCDVSAEEAASLHELEKDTWSSLVQVLAKKPSIKPHVDTKAETVKKSNKLALGFGRR